MQHKPQYYRQGGHDVGGYWNANCPTMVIWSQNDEGRKKWTPTDEKVDLVKKAFGTFPSSDAMKQAKSGAEVRKMDVEDLGWIGIKRVANIDDSISD